MKMFYINLVSNFQEFEDALQPDEKYRVSYAKKAVRQINKGLHAVKSSSKNTVQIIDTS
jgi:hypothetical protein